MSWEMKSIGQVCDVIPGFAFKSKDLGETGIPVVKIGNITDDYRVDIDSIQHLPENLIKEMHEKFMLGNDDIVIAMTGATAGKVGRINCPKEQVLLLNQRVAKFKPRNINPDFFWSAISTPRYRTIFYGLGGGAAQPNMSGAQIEDVKIPYPPPTVQDRIASILSAYDDLIENNRRRIQLLEQAARLLYKEWFVHLRFPGHEQVKIKDGVPEGWESKPLSELCTDIRESINPKDVSPDTAYIGLEHIPKRAVTLNEWGTASEVDSNKFKFAEGDILFGKIRPYFHKVGFALVDGIVSSDAIVIRPSKDYLYYYVLFLLSSDEFVALASKTVREGSKMPRMDWKYLLRSQFKRPTPTLLSLFSDIVAPACNQLRNLALHNKQLAQAHDLLLPRLMDGDLMPSSVQLRRKP